MKYSTKSSTKSDTKCPAFLFIVFFAAFAITFSVFSTIASPQEDPGLDIPPPIRAVQITRYDKFIQQNAGTTATYDIVVKGTGVLEPTAVTMREDRLLDTWFAAKNTISGLMFGDEDTLQYELTIPRTAEGGTHIFSIVAYATYGTATRTDIQPVFLEIIPYEGTVREVPVEFGGEDAGAIIEKEVVEQVAISEDIGGGAEDGEVVVITPEELKGMVGDIICIGDVCGEVEDVEIIPISEVEGEETEKESIVVEAAKSTYNRITGFVADARARISARVPAAGDAGDLVQDTAKNVAKPFEFVFSLIQKAVSFVRRAANSVFSERSTLMNIATALLALVIILGALLRYLLKE